MAIVGIVEIAAGMGVWLSPKILAYVVAAWLGVIIIMTLRGVEASGSLTVSSALHGLLRDDEWSRAEFFALVG